MIQKADKREQRVAVVLALVLIIVFGVMLYGYSQWQTQIETLVASGGWEQAQKQMGLMRLFMFGLMIFSALGIAWMLARQAHKVLLEQRFPASNTPVFRDTEILTGAAAVRMARKLYFAAAGAIVLALIALYFAVSD
jgi:TRAP-type C4-dicarboxylate transport system permease small subunit